MALRRSNRELMIRQDESSGSERARVLRHADAGPVARTPRRSSEGFRGRFGRRVARSPRVRAPTRNTTSRGGAVEERFLDALTGIAHAEVRSIGPALAHMRSGSSPDTSLVFVSAPPVPAELGSLIRAGAGFGQKLAVLIYPTDPDRLPPERQAQIEGRASQARLSLARVGWDVIVLPPSMRLRETMAHDSWNDRSHASSDRDPRRTPPAAATALAFGRVLLGASTTLKCSGRDRGRRPAGRVRTAQPPALHRQRADRIAVASAMIVFRDPVVRPSDRRHAGAALDAAALVGERPGSRPPARNRSVRSSSPRSSRLGAVFSPTPRLRAGSPLLGLIPPVAAGGIPRHGARGVREALYGVLFPGGPRCSWCSRRARRVQGWVPCGPGQEGVAGSAGRGARRLALTALGVAFLSPIVVPGFGSKALVDFGSPAEGRVAIDPFVSVLNELTQETPVEVFRVRTSQPAYVRLVSLPDFDGVLWKPSAEEGAVVEDGDLELSTGRRGARTRVIGHGHLRIAGYRAGSITSTGAGRTGGSTRKRGHVRRPPTRGMRELHRRGVTRQPTADDLGSSLSRPAERPVPVQVPVTRRSGVARRWIDGADNDFVRRAIQDTCGTPPSSGTRSKSVGVDNAIIDFLTNRRRGSARSATAMASCCGRWRPVYPLAERGLADGDRMPHGAVLTEG